MKTILIVAASLLAVVASQALSKHPPADRDSVQKELLKIEDEIATANNRCDYVYFRKIEADDFLFTDSQGNVTTKQEDLAGEKDCKPHEDRNVIDEPRIILDRNLAVLSARSTLSGQRNGKDFTRRTRFTDVFAWRDGRWQLVAGHSSRIPEKQ